MIEQELMDALDGLHAYDAGAVDSGMRDEPLRARCIAELRARTGPNELYPRVLIGRLVRDLYLTDERLEQGYGPEDVAGFIEWLDDQLNS